MIYYHKIQRGMDSVIGLMKSPSGDIEGYLISLKHKKPKTIFGYPLYLFRCFLNGIVLLTIDEVYDLTLDANRYGHIVHAGKKRFSGLESSQAFVSLMKKHCICASKNHNLSDCNYCPKCGKKLKPEIPVLND